MGEMGGTTLMIAGGGTGGHIYPAIAIAREFVARDPARRVVFVGTEYGLEKTIVPRNGFPLEFISVGGLKGKGPLDLARNLGKLPLGFAQAWRTVGRNKPDAVLGVGGYSSGPVLLAAWMRGVPTMLHEQNAFPGLTNRLAAKFVKAVAVAFEDASSRLKRSDAVVTGNPVRREFFDLVRPAEPKRVLVFGGSQGSKVLNDAMTGALAHLPPDLQIVHQTGPRMLEDVQKAYRSSPFPHARVIAFIDPMVDELLAADLVVCRAGAMTIAELAAAGRGSVLIPFAAATNNHQEANARVMERAHGAIVITEKELTPEKLAAAVGEIVQTPNKTAQMAAAAKSLAAVEATKRIVDTIEKII